MHASDGSRILPGEAVTGLTKKQRIDKSKLDGAGYFSALLACAAEFSLLSEEEAFYIQEQLWPLMGRQTAKYTLGDSSSVPVEAAQELFQSVCYTVGLYLKTLPDESHVIGQLKTKSMDALFLMGQETLKASVGQGKEVLKELQSGRIRTKNIAYNDTAAKLPVFFRDYDMRFFAHETPCDIDYPLCIPVPEWGGIEYICAYMLRLGIENAFCRNFAPENIERLLAGYCRDPENLLINVFEPVFFNALGLTLLHADVHKLTITPAERDLLLSMLQNSSLQALDQRLSDALETLCAKLGVEDGEAHVYLMEVKQLLLHRLYEQLKNGDLSALFITFKEMPAKTQSARFEDGEQMPDEELRKLIGKMQSVANVEDKVFMVKSRVKSLSDLIEVLNECFSDGECARVFELLTDIELSELLKKLYVRRGDAFFNSAGNVQWENEFLDYLSGMDNENFEFLIKSIRA